MGQRQRVKPLSCHERFTGILANPCLQCLCCTSLIKFQHARHLFFTFLSTPSISRQHRNPCQLVPSAVDSHARHLCTSTTPLFFQHNIFFGYSCPASSFHAHRSKTHRQATQSLHPDPLHRPVSLPCTIVWPFRASNYSF